MYGLEITPFDVSRVLDGVGVVYVLVGAHAAAGYTGAPRATIDVDVVVRHPKKAAAELTKAFPHLTARDTPVVTRLVRADGVAVIDVMKANTSELWRRLLKIARPIRIGSAVVRVPPVEGMLAAKLAAMVSPHRLAAKKMFDAGDFIQIVQVNQQLDLRLLRELGELVYAGGGQEILKLVDDVRAGRPLRV